MLNWYALNSKPHREKFLQNVLVARGAETFLPLWYSRGPGSELHPYFPSYLFARLDLERVGISKIQFLPGLRRIVFRGDEPAVIEQLVIDEIRKHLEELKTSFSDQSGRTLAPGDRVVITGGLFKGYEAIFDRQVSSSERARVLIDFLQRHSPCELEARWLKKV